MNVGSTTSSNYSRITGLATGLDTDNMVKQMLAGDMMKIDTQKQSKQYLEWQQEAYVDIIKDLKEFQNSYLDILGSKETTMMNSLTYSGFKATSTDENKIIATAYGGAVKGTYNVRIDSLATGAKAQSDALNSATLDSTLDSLGLGITAADDGTFKISVNGEAFTISVESTDKISDLTNKIKNATSTAGTVLGNVVDVSFSELTAKLSITTKDTGSSQELIVEKGTSDIMNKFGMDNTVAGPAKGTNAKVYITPPGETEVEVVRSSNQFTIDNINYNIISGQVGDTVSINVSPDATSQVDKFKNFIEKYNSLIEKINNKINEKKNYNFKPLTDDQKSEMSDEEIERWEEQSKKGLLRKDNALTGMLVSIRQAFYDTVEGAGISITDIGISTTSNFRDGGKLQIDESKLKEALETRGDQVQKLFTQSGETYAQKGIFQKIKDVLSENIGNDGSLIKKAGYENTRWSYNNDLSKSIEDKNTFIKNIERNMYNKQERYYKMFARLETAMNQLNSQSNWLYSQMGAQ